MLCAPFGFVARVQAAGPAASGALSGRLTDLHSAPLPEVAIVLRNQSTGAEWRATTGRNGAYRFPGIAPGSYSLRAENRGGQLNDIVVAAGHEAHVLAAMDVRPDAPLERAPTVAASRWIPAAPAVKPSGQVAPAVPAGLSEPAVLSATTTLIVPPRSRPSLQPESPRVSSTIATEPVRMQALRSSAISRAAAQVSPQDSPQLWPEPVEIAGGVGLRAAVTLPLLGVAQPSPGAIPAAQAQVSQSAAARATVLQPDPVSTAVTTVLTGEQLQSLPTSGRRWQDLFLDTPAAAPGAAGGELALRGAGQGPADTTIDGASTRLAFGNPAAYSSGGSGAALSAQDASTQSQGGSTGFSGGRGLAVSAAAIREVRIVAGNVEAEGAHAAGGRAGVETESGGNALHGQGFFSDRQNTWGAESLYAMGAEHGHGGGSQFCVAAVYAARSRNLVGIGRGRPHPARPALLVWRVRWLPAQRSRAGLGKGFCGDVCACGAHHAADCAAERTVG